jgi:L-seryl-tRNA(Ser) seleniumtransferase
MISSIQKELLRQLPPIGDLLEHELVRSWLDDQPRSLVLACLRDAVDDLRRQIREDTAGRCGPTHVTTEFVVQRAGELLSERTKPSLRSAINATGVILHTGLGRAVWPETVVDSMIDDLAGYVTLAIDRDTGARSSRDQRIESILTELSGAEAATVVNNNAAATMIVLAALAAGREVIVSRGQLIEIGGSFRLPDVMAQSGAQLVEVGTTNRTHARDYKNAITPNTAALLRAHPSNFRIVGFTKETSLAELVAIAAAHNKERSEADERIIVIDDLGAGALVDLADYGLPSEPTVQESIAAGADVVLFSTDKLIGASQGGAIVGKKDLIDRIRKHPLARALRPDKTCLMALERTLMLFRDPGKLAHTHPLYRMLATPLDSLRQRAEALRRQLQEQPGASKVEVGIEESVGYLGSGSLPMQALPTIAVTLHIAGIKSEALARALRLDEACIFSRVERERVVLDMRTVTDEEVALIAGALARIAS